jgi:hypothetical protein
MFVSYGGPSLKNNRLVARTFTVGESAHCLSSLVLEACKQLVELLHAK